jgi:hypothetical protein
VIIGELTPHRVLWPGGDPDVLVRTILRQSAYHAENVDAARVQEETIWEELWDWCRAFLGKLLARFIFWISSFPAVRGASKLLGILLLATAAIAFLILAVRLVMWIFRFSPARRLEEKSARSSPERSASAWYALASEEALQGRYRAAVCALFMAALRLLDERSVLVFDVAKTPNEYRKCVAELAATAAPAFDELSFCFVRAMYASGIPEQPIYDRAVRAYVAFVAKVSAR